MATQGASLAPPSSSSPPLRENSGRNEPTAAGSGGNSGASSARASIVSESVAPPSKFVYTVFIGVTPYMYKCLKLQLIIIIML